jgi:cysteate synthase
MRAQVLGNRNPPYSITGGLYDALSDTDGFMYRVTNEEARSAGILFEESEGCDIDPAAEVAVASLLDAARGGRIRPQDAVLLNITGGGRRRLLATRRTAALREDATFTIEELRTDGPARGLQLLREALA